MLRVNAGNVKGYEKMDIPYTILSKTDKPKGLAIIFPGAGYTVQAPLLHYSTDVFLNKSYDVLHVNYHYNDKFYANLTLDELMEAVKFDSKAVVDNVLASRSYKSFYLIGKSLGTIALSSESKREDFQNARVVWLTALLSDHFVFNAMVNSTNKGLCLIGEDDHFYIVERFNQLLNNSKITSKLIPNVNHSLEYDDNVLESITVLKNVIADIEHI